MESQQNNSEYAAELKPKMDQLVKDFEDPEKGDLFGLTASYLHSALNDGEYTIDDIVNPDAPIATLILKTIPDVKNQGLLAFGIYKTYLDQNSDFFKNHKKLYDQVEDGTGPLTEYATATKKMNDAKLLVEYITKLAQLEAQIKTERATRVAAGEIEKNRLTEEASERKKKQPEQLAKFEGKSDDKYGVVLHNGNDEIRMSLREYAEKIALIREEVLKEKIHDQQVSYGIAKTHFIANFHNAFTEVEGEVLLEALRDEAISNMEKFHIIESRYIMEERTPDLIKEYSDLKEKCLKNEKVILFITTINQTRKH